MELADRVVVVTGATGPLGRALVAAFAAEGCRLGLIGTDEERLKSVATELGVDAKRWAPGVGDLRRPDEAKAAVAAVEGRFERVDALLHAVGGFVGGTPVTELDPTEMGSMVDQHLWTTLHAIQAVLPGMVERGWGRIVAVSTPVAANPVAKMSSYAVAKAAEETLLRAVAKEVAGTGVTANVVLVEEDRFRSRARDCAVNEERRLDDARGDRRGGSPAVLRRRRADQRRAHPTRRPLRGWSGRRGSNSRHSAWKADALPTELLPHVRNATTSRSPSGATPAGA